MVFRKKKQKHCTHEELTQGDCWIGLSLAQESGLIISMRVGKHTDAFLSELVANTEGKTDCKFWYTDDWGGYERILPPEVIHIIGKQNTQRLERTNGIVFVYLQGKLCLCLQSLTAQIAKVPLCWRFRYCIAAEVA